MAGADKEAKKQEYQKRYRDQHHERLKALNRQRYQARIKRLKTSGEYETFKAKKAVKGLKRYWDMTEEAREEQKRKNLLCQKNWKAKKIAEALTKSTGPNSMPVGGLNPRPNNEPWAPRLTMLCSMNAM